MQHNHPEIHSLLQVSARLGQNPLLSQAASGNTSVKLGSTLWIKASGKWLADAGREEILVPVDLEDVRVAVERGTDFAAQFSHSSGNRLIPSIETSMHAVIPWPAVIHVHSVNTISWAIREDGPELLRVALQGLRWQWIPYVASGLSLARAVAGAFEEDAQTEVLVLGNHGLVVCGVNSQAAEAVLMEVESRLGVEPRRAPKPDVKSLQQRISGESEWGLPESTLVHALSTDAISRTILLEGIMYPCQAMFLGPTTPLLTGRDSLTGAVERYQVANGVLPRFFLVEGQGVVLHERMTAAERENLLGLASVVQRIDVEANIRYLSDAELRNVLHAEAYRYRSLVEHHYSAASGVA